MLLLSGRSRVSVEERSRRVTQQVTDRFWQAEARTEETKQFIRDIKRITRRKFTAEEKIRIVLERLPRGRYARG